MRPPGASMRMARVRMRTWRLRDNPFSWMRAEETGREDALVETVPIHRLPTLPDPKVFAHGAVSAARYVA